MSKKMDPVTAIRKTVNGELFDINSVSTFSEWYRELAIKHIRSDGREPTEEEIAEIVEMYEYMV